MKKTLVIKEFYLTDVEEGRKGVQRQDQVSALHRVTRHVSESPGGLLAHVLVLGHEQLDEDGHGAGLDHVLGVVGGTRSDVGEGPSSLELQSLCDNKTAVPTSALTFNKRRLTFFLTGLSFICRNWTNLYTTPESITAWMGGFFSVVERGICVCR